MIKEKKGILEENLQEVLLWIAAIIIGGIGIYFLMRFILGLE